jgi:hypothetical protein
MLFYTPATTTAIDVILLHMLAVLGSLAQCATADLCNN